MSNEKGASLREFARMMQQCVAAGRPYYTPVCWLAAASWSSPERCSQPAHSGYVREKPNELYSAWVLRKKERWSFTRKGIVFGHRGHDLTGYHDFRHLFFAERDPRKRQSPDNLLVGDLTLPYSLLPYNESTKRMARPVITSNPQDS
jgi:hypothetical protein